MEFDVIDICTHTIIVFLIYVYLLKYVLPLLDKYPPQTKSNLANLLTMPPTSHMPPPSSHIHTKTHRYIAGSIFCKTIGLTFVFHEFIKNVFYYHVN